MDNPIEFAHNASIKELTDFSPRMKPAEKRYITFFSRKFSKFFAITFTFNIPSGDYQMPVIRKIFRRLQDFVAPFAVIKAAEIANLNNFASGLSFTRESFCIQATSMCGKNWAAHKPFKKCFINIMLNYKSVGRCSIMNPNNDIENKAAKEPII